MIEERKVINDKERKISLHQQHHKLADVQEQIEILEHSQANDFVLPSFKKNCNKMNCILSNQQA